MRRFLPFAALLGVVFVLGCQDLGSGPVGLQAPQFDQPGLTDDQCAALNRVLNKKGHCHGAEINPDRIEALLFENPSFTCAAGATDTDGASFGQVGWQTDRIFVGEAALPASDHIHFDLQLTGVDAGDYTIFGNQAEDPTCAVTNGEAVDIGTVKVKKNGKVLTPGILQFEFPNHDAAGLTTHVWLTISGPGGIFRSPAVEVVIPQHEEVQ